jgi:hypothetical protein
MAVQHQADMAAQHQVDMVAQQEATEVHHLAAAATDGKNKHHFSSLAFTTIIAFSTLKFCLKLLEFSSL